MGKDEMRKSELKHDAYMRLDEMFNVWNAGWKIGSKAIQDIFDAPFITPEEASEVANEYIDRILFVFRSNLYKLQKGE